VSAYTTRHAGEEIDYATETLPVIADAVPGRIVSARESENPFPQVITPTAIQPGHYAPHPHQILDPHHVARLMGSPTRQAPRWLVGVKDLFGHAADHHVLPAAGVLTLFGVSAWAHCEPYHPLIGAGIITVGAYLMRAGIKAHRHHGADADAVFTKGLLGAGATLGVTGAVACAGLSPWSAVALTLALGGSYVAWHQWQHHKLERAREFSVALVAAGNTGPTPLPPAGYAPGALPYSDEEGRLRAAFLKLNAPDVILSPVRRVADGVWSVYADLIDTKLTAEQLESDPNRLASYTRGSRRVEVLPGARQSQVKLIVYDGDDPLEEPVPGPGPQITSILQPLGLGRFEDGSEISQPLAWNHALVGGATDNGKSGVLNAAIIGTLGCRDVVRIGIDCKAGAPEFGVYRPVMFHLAENPQDGMRVLAGLEAVYEYRGQLLKEKGVPSEENEDGVPVRKWRPEFGPFILALIDELERMTSSVPGAAKRIQDLNALARFVAIIRWDATQTPSRGVFGGKTDARLNYQIRAGVRTMEIQANNMIMGPGAHTRGWDLRMLNQPGKMMIQSRQYDRPRIGRAYYYTDEEIARYVAQYKGKVAELDEGSAAAFWEGYHAAFDTEESDGGDDGPRGGKRTDPIEVAQGFHRGLYVVPEYPGTKTPVEEKYRDLWALLGEQDGPTSAPDLSAMAKSEGHDFSSESWIRAPLRYWLKNGWIESERRSGTDYFWRPDAGRQRRDADGAAS
jgi:FtsK/SpoIIIE family